ncbi:hypothetical protein F8S13_20680 [Chloroflexia bacterium SDU3-3]|nr:hypothetical protein F8S13_20680 [Chloroflexia bacterium SDU3-3]
MDEQGKRYPGEGVVVRYNAQRCIHFAACVRGLPQVFDPQRRPWIMASNAEADALAEVVRQCPTGALHIERLDGGQGELPAAHATAHVTADGPLHMRGTISVRHEDGTALASDTRVALCRCGMSASKPFCDGSHRQGFRDPGGVATRPQAAPAEGPLEVTVCAHGPYRTAGTLAIHSADGGEPQICRNAALCRCGLSASKPFCDGSHTALDPEELP